MVYKQSPFEGKTRPPQIRPAVDSDFFRPMEKVRLGIVGMGAMGRHHAHYLLAGKVGRLELVAASDSDPKRMTDLPEKIRRFAAADDLFGSGTIDAVLIATPHYSHSEVGIAALEAGLHVMVEKPLSAHLLDARR